MRQSFPFLLSTFILLVGCQPQNELGKIMTPVEVWEYADKCGANPECYDTAADHYFQSLELSEGILAKGGFSGEVFNHFSEAIQLGNKKTALKILKNQTAAKKYSLIKSGIYEVNSGLATPQSYITLLDFWDTDVLSGNMNRHDLIENWDIHHKDQRHKRNMKESTSDLIGSIEHLLLRDEEVNEYIPYIFETYSKKFLEQSKSPYWWVSKDREGLMLRGIERLDENYKSTFEGAEPSENPGWLLNVSDAEAICNATELMLKRLLKRSDVSTIPNIEQSLDAVFQGLENFVVYRSIDSHYEELIEAGFLDIVKASIERRAIRKSGFQTRKDLLPYARMDFYGSVLEFPEKFDVEIKELSTLARETLSNKQPSTFTPINPQAPTLSDIEVYKIKNSLRFLTKYVVESKLEPGHTDIELIGKWKLGNKPLPLTFKKRDDESWDDLLTRIETKSPPKRLSYNMLNMLEYHEPRQRAYEPDDSKNQHLINTPVLMRRITPHLKRNERPEFLKALALAGDPEGAAKLFIHTANIGSELQALFIADAYAASSNDDKAKQWLLIAVDKCKKTHVCSSYIYKRIIASGGMKHLYSEDSPLLRIRKRIDKNLYEVLLESDAPDSIKAIERHMEFQLSHDHELDALPLVRLTAAHCGTESIKPLHREILSRVKMKYSNFELNRAIEALIENDCFELVDLAFEKVTPEFGKKREIKDVITSLIDNGHVAELPKWFRKQTKGPEIYANFRHTAHRLRLKQANDQWTLSQE